MTYKEAYVKASNICARQEKCISDIEKKLYDWQVNESDRNKIINQLIDEKFIDEERFVRYYVKDKFVFNKWGKIKIRWQLKAKSIHGPIVENALNEISTKDYKETLVQLLNTKKKSIKHDDPFKIKSSLIRFASSRGFEPEIIYQTLDDIEIL